MRNLSGCATPPCRMDWPQVTRWWPCTSKSDRTPVLVSRVCITVTVIKFNNG
jgi:hypothetical protein